MSSTKGELICHNCENSYFIYFHQLKQEEDKWNTPVDCPFCDARIPEAVWKHVTKAIESVHNANLYFRKAVSEYKNADFFELNVESVYVPNDKFRNINRSE